MMHISRSKDVSEFVGCVFIITRPRTDLGFERFVFTCTDVIVMQRGEVILHCTPRQLSRDWFLQASNEHRVPIQNRLDGVMYFGNKWLLHFELPAVGDVTPSVGIEVDVHQR